jgi:type II secretory ATPase GspE/PulE/Tfp pilus assembly ATPase PilB-like protein
MPLNEISNDPNNSFMKNMRLGEILLHKGLIQKSMIDFCLHEQKITGERFGQVMERCGFVTHRDILESLSLQHNIAVVEIGNDNINEDCLRLFNENLCRNNQFIPLFREGDVVTVATSAFDHESVKHLLERYCGLDIILCFSDRSRINKLITTNYNNAGRSQEYYLEREIATLVADKESALRLDPLVNLLVRMALEKRATDIHVRPMEHSINIAFRIDGVMLSILSLGSNFKRLISTIKLLANMDIAETRKAQDGSFDLKLDEAFFDIRVSTIACSYGENIVMRLLSRNQDVRRMENLGFEPDHLSHILGMFRRPSGIFLITGPTGSGKTTTLHAGIMSLDILNKNILTIEDPIEYQLPIVRQTQVNSKAGYEFSGAIRNFLRHDPDIIVVGEIRDSVTASAALDAAETGHLVLSTMHTNNAIGIVPRLKSLQADTHQLADVLVGALSQRLIRRNCKHCIKQIQPTFDHAKFLKISIDIPIYKSEGCSRCNFTGFIGRIPIYEIVEFSDELRNAVHSGESLTDMYRIAKKYKYTSMYEVSRSRVLTGETSIEEVLFHVVPPEE